MPNLNEAEPELRDFSENTEGEEKKTFPEPQEPIKPDAVWNFNSLTNSREIDLKSVITNTSMATFSYLESQRANLETRIGVEALLRVYKMILELEEKNDDDKLDCSDFQQILGSGNEDLIDDVIQLVVSDQLFNIDQR